MKKLFYIIIAAILLLLAVLISVITLVSVKPSVAFYHVDELVQNVLLKELNSSSTKKYKVIVLDEEIPLSEQTKTVSKANLLIALNDKNVQEFTANSSKVVEPVVPVLYDFYLLDLNRKAEKTSAFSKLQDLQDFYFYSSEITGKIPALQFAGGDPAEMLNTLGMFYEALHGWTAYEALLEDFYNAWKTENLEDYFSYQVSESGSLYEVISLLKKYLDKEIFNRKCLGFNSDDLLFQIDNDQTLNVILKLSDHHRIAQSNTNRFNPELCPAASNSSNKRKYVAAEICAISLKNSSGNKKALSAMNEHQAELSTLTGLAPADAGCSTSDALTEEISYWRADSEGTLMPLSGALPSADAQRIAADEIKYAITN